MSWAASDRLLDHHYVEASEFSRTL